MKRRLLAEWWGRYECNVMPASAGPVQRKETHQAFYAGAASIMTAIMQNVTDGPDCNPADERLMEDLWNELDEWVAQLPGPSS